MINTYRTVTAKLRLQSGGLTGSWGEANIRIPFTRAFAFHVLPLPNSINNLGQSVPLRVALKLKSRVKRDFLTFWTGTRAASSSG